jgi:hypothetical protein
VLFLHIRVAGCPGVRIRVLSSLEETHQFRPPDFLVLGAPHEWRDGPETLRNYLLTLQLQFPNAVVPLAPPETRSVRLQTCKHDVPPSRHFAEEIAWLAIARLPAN